MSDPTKEVINPASIITAASCPTHPLYEKLCPQNLTKSVLPPVSLVYLYKKSYICLAVVAAVEIGQIVVDIIVST